MSERSIPERLAETLEQTLVPVRPPEAFRAHLRTNLRLASQHNASLRRYRRRGISWRNAWVAVVAFTASIAAGSVLAYIIRSRLTPPASL